MFTLKTFLYWADVSVTWAKTFLKPDLCCARTNKCETFHFNVLFLVNIFYSIIWTAVQNLGSKKFLMLINAVSIWNIIAI